MIIRSRASWSPRYVDGVHRGGNPVYAPLPATLFLHHSVTTPPSATITAEAAHMRTLENIGQTRFSSGISYTWVVFPSGRVWQGHSVSREGTHTYGHNRTGRGVCLVGNYHTVDVPDLMVATVVELITETRKRGWITDAPMRGHRDVRSTACPGDRAYALIPTINSLAAGGNAGGGGNQAMTPEQEKALYRRLHTLERNVTRWTAHGHATIPHNRSADEALPVHNTIGRVLQRLDEIESRVSEIDHAELARELIRQLKETP